MRFRKSLIVEWMASVAMVWALLALSGCAERREPLRLSEEAAEAANPRRIPYEARSYRDGLEIFEGGKKVCRVWIGGASIERWGFIDEGRHIAVRSGQRNGKTLLELFETDSCRRVDEVLWPDSDPPRWAESLFD